ncbi:MAG TPA: phosphate signaling complex protein PhoU [Rhodocyclaceae bacterium]|jgi:phosphate transport system protein|nr:phosphate signaling complex protein PhoU [Rhodocyclaceae bacterium]
MFVSDHSSKQFDQELGQLRTRVLQMGGLVEKQIVDAIDAFGEGDLAAMERVENDDHRVNAQEVGIDEACALIIARRQPAAGDLRMLMGISKIVTDLERCGDKAAKIARKSKLTYEYEMLRIPCVNDIREMGRIAVALLHMALDAFARQDAVAAAVIVRDDLEIDEKFQSITRQLITFMMEDPRMISISLEILFIAKAVERVGDHAKNIAEQIIYIERGTDVRHVTFDQLEREAKGTEGTE